MKQENNVDEEMEEELILNYKKGMIYKLFTTDSTQLFYIGKTTLTKERRLRNHESGFRAYKKGTGDFCSSYHILETGNYKILPIYNLGFETREEMNKCEQHYINTYKKKYLEKCVNQNRAYVSLEDKKITTRNHQTLEKDKLISKKRKSELNRHIQNDKIFQGENNNINDDKESTDIQHYDKFNRIHKVFVDFFNEKMSAITGKPKISPRFEYGVLVISDLEQEPDLEFYKEKISQVDKRFECFTISRSQNIETKLYEIVVYLKYSERTYSKFKLYEEVGDNWKLMIGKQNTYTKTNQREILEAITKNGDYLDYPEDKWNSQKFLKKIKNKTECNNQDKHICNPITKKNKLHEQREYDTFKLNKKTENITLKKYIELKKALLKIDVILEQKDASYLINVKIDEDSSFLQKIESIIHPDLEIDFD